MYVYILRIRLPEEDGRCWSKHTKITINDTILLISVFTLKNERFEL